MGTDVFTKRNNGRMSNFCFEVFTVRKMLTQGLNVKTGYEIVVFS